MLESARDLDSDGRVEWVQSDLREWDPASLGQAPDVIVTNSTLQWIPGHLDLLDALGRGARPGRVVRAAGAGELRRPEPPADARDG